LESGDKTLLNHVLQNKKELKVVVTVNDMSEINVDADLLKSKITLFRSEEKLIKKNYFK
tara:strand:+ start:2933 stop:3109 length:177 start_codon:yes stop_codon:yes gene_type:complete